jgi:hypothetical protein
MAISGLKTHCIPPTHRRLRFKAAQIQSNDNFVLRRQEMIFIEKRNISKWPEIEKAA